MMTQLDQPQEVRMGFGEHLDELRKRLIRALTGSIFTIALSLYYTNHIIGFLVGPYRLALRYAGYPDTLVFGKPAEVVIIYMTVGLKVGLILASPWIIYQLWQFVGAGLYGHEKKVIYRYLAPSVALFATGVGFFFFIVLPLTLKFFVGFTQNTAPPIHQPTYIERKIFGESPISGLDPTLLPAGNAVNFSPIPLVKSDPEKGLPGQLQLWFNAVDGKLKGRVGESDKIVTFLMNHQDSLFTPMPTLDDYLSLVTFLALIFGAAFETPIVILVLAQLNLVSVKTFRSIRRYAWFGMTIAATIIAPTPDPATMLMMLVPLVGLYEVGILVAVILVKKPEEVPEEAEETDESSV